MICPADVNTRGTAWLFSVTQEPPRMLSKAVDAGVPSDARLVPKMGATLPGAKLGW